MGILNRFQSLKGLFFPVEKIIQDGNARSSQIRLPTETDLTTITQCEFLNLLRQAHMITQDENSINSQVNRRHVLATLLKNVNGRPSRKSLQQTLKTQPAHRHAWMSLPRQDAPQDMLPSLLIRAHVSQRSPLNPQLHRRPRRTVQHDVENNVSPQTMAQEQTCNSTLIHDVQTTRIM
jgi:hypothetical protein